MRNIEARITPATLPEPEPVARANLLSLCSAWLLHAEAVSMVRYFPWQNWTVFAIP